MSEAATYACKIESIVLYKFGSLIAGEHTPDKITSIDISLQVLEVNIYESLFSQYLKAEIAVIDQIGLLFNFPLSGEEAVVIRYQNLADQTYNTLYMIIDGVSNLAASDDARAMGYVINCVSIESYANNKQTVQQAYHDTAPNIVKKIFDQHIVERINKVFPSYVPQPLIVENNDTLPGTVIIPNLHPFAAIEMMGQIAGESKGRFTHLIYQTVRSYNFKTLQSMIDPNMANIRRKAFKNKYVYMSNQITDGQSQMNNEGRVVSKLTFNQRLSSFSKLSAGYYHNTLFEINIAQKAFWGEHTRTQDVATLYPNALNTEVFTQLASIEGDQEQSNRTKYVVTTQKENDDQFPISRIKDKWGRDIIASTAISQIDLSIVIPGTSLFTVGELIYLEIPEFHGFNEVLEDDLLSGYFLITEIKHILHQGGYHTTVMQLNRDSYNDSIDRKSRYAR